MQSIDVEHLGSSLGIQNVEIRNNEYLLSKEKI